jgi:transposase
MDITTLCHHLLNADQLLIRQILIENNKIDLEIESTATRSYCPMCQEESRAVHSTYMRYPVDLAWADREVIINLKVKRFFCRNGKCKKRTFAERFPGVIYPYARRTNRVIEKQQRIGINTCARIAEKLLDHEQIGISDSTVNRILRKLPDPEVYPIRVLGVDDWAKRKGQEYGTILIDLERSRIIDLLNDRTAATLTQWLKGRPGIEIVSRDRSQTYAEAVADGLPDAIQVADRWHLLKNLSDTVYKILQQEDDVIKKQLAKKSGDEKLVSQAAGTHVVVESLTLAEERRKKRIDNAQKLLQLGWTQKSVARHLNIHPKTVCRYSQSISPKSRRARTSRLLDAFKPYMLKRWNEGCHNAAQLFREIKQQGFAGEVTIVRLFVRQLRQASDLPPKVRCQGGKNLNGDPTQSPPSLRKLTNWIIQRPEDLSDVEKKILTEISSGQPKLFTTIELARAFAALVRQRKSDELDPWLDKASKSGCRVLLNFATGLKQDYNAVRAALLLPWSNGPTEGHINRLKFLKRQMYGRAKEDLLRKRALWQGRWSFT